MIKKILFLLTLLAITGLTITSAEASWENYPNETYGGANYDGYDEYYDGHRDYNRYQSDLYNNNKYKSYNNNIRDGYSDGHRDYNRYQSDLYNNSQSRNYNNYNYKNKSYKYSEKQVRRYKHRLSPGWNTISFPGRPVKSFSEAFYDDSNNRISLYGRMKRWEENSNKYNMYRNNYDYDYRYGYMIYSKNYQNIYYDGYQNDEDYRFRLDRGYNMLAYPYDYSQDIDRASIYSRSLRQAKSFDEARRAGWIKSKLYDYDNNCGCYNDIERDSFEPWNSYWIYVRKDDLEVLLKRAYN